MRLRRVPVGHGFKNIANFSDFKEMYAKVLKVSESNLIQQIVSSRKSTQVLYLNSEFLFKLWQHKRHPLRKLFLHGGWHQCQIFFLSHFLHLVSFLYFASKNINFLDDLNGFLKLLFCYFSISVEGFHFEVYLESDMGQGIQEWAKKHLWKTSFKKFEVRWST